MSTLFANRKDRTLYVHDGAANYIVAHIFQIIFQLLFSIIVIATMTQEEKTSFSGTFVYMIIICIVNQISVGFTPLSYSKVLGQNYYKDMGFNKKLSLAQIGLLILIAIALVFAFTPVANWIAQIFIKSGYDTSNLTSLVVTNPVELIVSIFFVALMPACFEEILYRGMIARAFARKNFIFAIFMGAFMFAIMHASPVQFVHQFMLGIVCCIVFFATGSIYASIIAHLTNNLIAVVGSYILYYHPLSIPIWGMILMVVFGILALTILLYVFVVLNNKDASLKNGIQSIDEVFRKCFAANLKTNDDEIKDEAIEQKIEDIGLEEMREVYAQEKELRSQDEKLKAKRGMIFALALAIIMFVVNTITGYMA